MVGSGGRVAAVGTLRPAPLGAVRGRGAARRPAAHLLPHDLQHDQLARAVPVAQGHDRPLRTAHPDLEHVNSSLQREGGAHRENTWINTKLYSHVKQNVSVKQQLFLLWFCETDLERTEVLPRREFPQTDRSVLGA